LTPSQVRYLAALRPDLSGAIIQASAIFASCKGLLDQ